MTRKAKVKALEKDWTKVNEGSPLQDDEFGMKTPEKHSHEEEVMAKTDEEKQTTSGEKSDDNDLILAQEKLRLLQIEEKKMRKKEKLQEIEKETKKLENSIKGKKKKNASNSLTSASLRSMGEVVSEVDRLMDRNRLKFQGDESSASEEEDESSSSSSSEEEKKRRRKDKKKISGKEKKVTSYVKYPQKWPHSHLKYHFVSKDKKYEELSIPEFCAGYMSILQSCKSSPKECPNSPLGGINVPGHHKTLEMCIKLPCGLPP